jgi:DNA-binding PadR family transcriptional regulator
MDGQSQGRPGQGKLNATSASLLGFLHERPMTGWELVATAEQRIGAFWSLTRSQVYRELAAMATTGLVEAGQLGPRDRRPYAITAAGRAAFHDWVETMPAPEQIRYPLLLALGFGEHLSRGVLAQFLAEHRAAHERRLAGYLEGAAHVREQGGVYAAAVLDFGIRYEEAVLGWFDALPNEMRARR